jgi:carbonic anhydrase
LRMLQLRGLYFLGLVILGACFSSVAFATTDDSGAKIAWGYKGNIGPEFWGRLNSHFAICGSGKSQSPIDISKNDIEVSNTLTLHYQAAPMVLMDNGITDLTLGSKQTIFNDGHTIQVNFHDPKIRELIMYQGEQYHLIQFHFHSPSENQLNGDSAPLEIHFVHQGKNGKVVVIGVLVKGGAPNAALKTILDHIPEADGKEHVVQGEMINPVNLFPVDNDYYSFLGSLTTPPCSEGLQWIVMSSTVTASPAQIATLRKAIGGSNARSVQPLNNRIIAYSQVKKP